MRLPRVDKSLNYGRPAVQSLLAKAAPFASVLDIGAGSGDDLLSARSVNPDASLFAVDFSSDCVERLESRGIQAVALNVEEARLPHPAESLDVVISNQTLEHTKDVHWILHQVATVLAPGGSFIVGVPNLASFHNRILLLAGRQPTSIRSVGPHVRGFTARDLKELIELPWAGGMRMVDVRGANFYPFPPPIARPLSRAFPTASWAIFLRFEKLRPYGGEYLTWLEEQRFETSFRNGTNTQPSED